jgi:hypothetical protein
VWAELAAEVKKLVHILHPSPFTVADHIRPGPFLEANGEERHLIHDLVKALGGTMPRGGRADRGISFGRGREPITWVKNGGSFRVRSVLMGRHFCHQRLRRGFRVGMVCRAREMSTPLWPEQACLRSADALIRVGDASGARTPSSALSGSAPARMKASALQTLRLPQFR